MTLIEFMLISIMKYCTCNRVGASMILVGVPRNRVLMLWKHIRCFYVLFICAWKPLGASTAWALISLRNWKCGGVHDYIKVTMKPRSCSFEKAHSCGPHTRGGNVFEPCICLFVCLCLIGMP